MKLNTDVYLATWGQLYVLLTDLNRERALSTIAVMAGIKIKCLNILDREGKVFALKASSICKNKCSLK